MNETNDPSQPRFRPHILDRLRFWAFLLASLLTLLALAWAVENWRGARAWDAVKRDLIAQGEPLTIDQLIPSKPADAENLAATPLLKPLLEYYPPGTPGRNQSIWIDPEAQARVNAIDLPQPRVLRSRPRSEAASSSDAPSEDDGRTDLMAYALGIRVRSRNCPPHLDPSLAERYGYHAPGARWRKPTNEAEIAASIVDPAQEVLLYLQRFDPELNEMAEAVRRPQSQFPIHWEEDYTALLPHLAPLKRFTQLFSVRAAARLRKQDTAGAFADALTCLRLAQALRNEPLLISQLVEIGQHAIAVETIWEGLESHQWSGDQVAAFQRELVHFDFQKQAVLALRGERVAQNHFLDHFSRMERSSVNGLSSDEVQTGPMLLLLQWVPGWIHQNQDRVNRYDNFQLRQLTDPRWPANLAGARDANGALARGGEYPGLAANHMDALNADAALRSAGLTKNTPYTLLARMITPDFTKVAAKAARAQTVNHLAMVACALEKYRLEHGAYPKELSQLPPADCPGSIQDPMSGAPLRYELSASAGFKLWSVGMNGRDDGGIMLQKDNDAGGDWVWPQPGQGKAPRLF